MTNPLHEVYPEIVQEHLVYEAPNDADADAEMANAESEQINSKMEVQSDIDKAKRQKRRPYQIPKTWTR